MPAHWRFACVARAVYTEHAASECLHLRKTLDMDGGCTGGCVRVACGARSVFFCLVSWCPSALLRVLFVVLSVCYYDEAVRMRCHGRKREKVGFSTSRAGAQGWTARGGLVCPFATYGG